jgi:tetratricopeptide (TPR) repeat protein
LDDAIALNDKDARAYRDRGYAHVLLRDIAQAEADVKRATEVDPSDYENFQMMANVYSFQDKYAPAIDAMTKAIEAYKPEKSGDPEKFIAGYLARADARLKLGEQEKDAQKSQAAFEAVIADAKSVLDLYDDRFPESGRAYFRQGRGGRLLQRYIDAVD